MAEYRNLGQRSDSNLEHIFSFQILYKLFCMIQFIHRFYSQPEKYYFDRHHIRINQKVLCFSLYIISLFASFLKHCFYETGEFEQSCDWDDIVDR